MKRLSYVCRTLSVCLALTLGAACAADGERGGVPVDPSGDEVEPGAVDRVDGNLERLRALEVFEVGELVVDGAETPETAAAALETFAGKAEQACMVTEVDAGLCGTDVVEGNLAALRELQIIEVGDLLAVEPQNNPNCYNLPCEEDVQAAEAATCERANKLAAIVRSATSQY